VTATSASVAAESTEDAPETPFPPAPIEDMLKLLAKGVRAHQLYMHNNPTYLRALELLRAGFAPIWAQTDDFTLKITESEFRWEGVPVSRESSKTADSLPWVFYKDGVRELRFQKGFEDDDLVKFLDCVQRARRNNPEEDDLLVMLWEQDMAHLRYRYVDVGDDGPVAVLADLAQAHAWEPRVVDPPTAEDEPRPEENLLASRPGMVNLEDFDSTLYFLDENEVQYLRDEVTKEYAGDLRGNVVAMLLDIFEVQEDPQIRGEIAEILDGFMLHLLSAAQFRSVAYLLVEAQAAANRAKGISASEKAQLAKIPDRLSDPQSLGQLLQSLEESPELPAQDDLNALFDQLRPAALGTIFGALARTQEPKVRTLMQNAAGRLAGANTAELVRLIGHSDRVVAVEAIRRAGALRSAAAVTPLVKRMSDPDPGTRLAVAQSLAEIGSAGALQALERQVDDGDRDVRVAAARAIAARAYRPALPRVEAVVKGKAIREADLTEKMAMFETFGALCGAGGIPLLDNILNGRTFLGKREDDELRACAAMALGRIGSDKAIETLRRAVNVKDIVVRNAVNKALRGGTT
jgi:HEAT repeat protein